MALRTIVHEGTEWTVWNVVPTLEKRLSIPLSPSTGSGWLCFQSAVEKRRIAPVPKGWEEWPDEELVEQLRGATVVPSGVPPRASAPGSEDASPSEELRRQVGETMQRARDLGEKVRLALQDARDPRDERE